METLGGRRERVEADVGGAPCSRGAGQAPILHPALLLPPPCCPPEWWTLLGSPVPF